MDEVEATLDAVTRELATFEARLAERVGPTRPSVDALRATHRVLSARQVALQQALRDVEARRASALERSAALAEQPIVPRVRGVVVGLFGAPLVALVVATWPLLWRVGPFEWLLGVVLQLAGAGLGVVVGTRCQRSTREEPRDDV